MCTNYMDLNKVCLKDAYPLPNIDRLVDDAAGHIGTTRGLRQLNLKVLQIATFFLLKNDAHPFGENQGSGAQFKKMTRPIQTSWPT